MQTSQTGGHWYSDTSPFSIHCNPCFAIFQLVIPLTFTSILRIVNYGHNKFYNIVHRSLDGKTLAVGNKEDLVSILQTFFFFHHRPSKQIS
jgi:hypothetical protein